jgi:ZIP family zinc transporter
LDWSDIGWGTLAGVCTGVATLIGALPILFNTRPTAGQQGIMLGFAAGVMLSASYLSLIVPAANFAREGGHGPFASAGIVAAAVLAGAASLHWLKGWEPFDRSITANPNESPQLGRRAWLLTLAMTTHNLPEGAAVGVGFAAGDPRIAISTAVGIGVQNLPEGLAVAAAMLSIGRSRTSAILIAGATGLVEPIGALLGVTLVSAVHGLLPVGMGWAAGAMLYICAAELIPAVHEDARTTSRALTAVLIGIASMLFLDTALAA